MWRKEQNRGSEVREGIDGQSYETGYKKKQTTEIRQNKRKVEEWVPILWHWGQYEKSLGANRKFKQDGGVVWKEQHTEKHSRFNAKKCWDWCKSIFLNQSFPRLHTVSIYSWSLFEKSRCVSDCRIYDHKPRKQFCNLKYYHQSQMMLKARNVVWE